MGPSPRRPATSHRYDVHGMWHRHNRWLVQVPRIYPVLHAAGAVHSFSELLANVFLPLWEVPGCPARLLLGVPDV